MAILLTFGWLTWQVDWSILPLPAQDAWLPVTTVFSCSMVFPVKKRGFQAYGVFSLSRNFWNDYRSVDIPSYKTKLVLRPPKKDRTQKLWQKKLKQLLL
jgi:hypothetical protein